MRSPFPGMDPYLEDQTSWSDFHADLIVAIRDLLAQQVSPNFFVHIEQRVYIVTLELERLRSLVPDVYVVTPPRASPAAATTAGTIETPTLLEPFYDTEIIDRYIEIHDSRNREVVTTIELLSPLNKTPKTEGYEAFRRKRALVFASPVHWVEIDLLREGERPPELIGKSDYYALLKRAGIVRPYEAWVFDLRDKLPTIAIPLRPPFPDVPLNLQAAFETTYARAHYADSVDYMRMLPPPPLRPADVVWSAERVREWLAARNGQATA
jgi:Protein of unknown function (DUF4058)